MREEDESNIAWGMADTEDHFKKANEWAYRIMAKHEGLKCGETCTRCGGWGCMCVPVLLVELDDAEAKYQELIMAVAKKYPGESRHETALRYIMQAEAVDCGPAQCVKEDE